MSVTKTTVVFRSFPNDTILYLLCNLSLHNFVLLLFYTNFVLRAGGIVFHICPLSRELTHSLVDTEPQLVISNCLHFSSWCRTYVIAMENQHSLHNDLLLSTYDDGYIHKYTENVT